MVGTPDITEVHLHDGEPLRFKAEFEVVPEIELKDYKGVEVPYSEPEVSDEDVAKRVEELREQKAEYVNIDPRPVEDGDHAVVALESIAGIEGDPVKTDEMVLEIGGADTLPEFTENLRGIESRRRARIRGRLPRGLRLRAPGRQDTSRSAPRSRASAARNFPN